MLVINEMPKHAHEEILYFSENESTRSVGTYDDANVGGFKTPKLGWSGSSTEAQLTSFGGNNEPHNNIQPYITVLIWKRIS